LRPFEGTPIGAALEQVVQRLEAKLPPPLLAHFSRLGDRVEVCRSDAPEYQSSAGVLAALRDALSRGVTTRLEYEALDGSQSAREVHPQALVWGPRGLYLFALDETRGGALRTFRVERIRAARPTPAPALHPPGFDVDALLASSLGIYCAEHPLVCFRIALFAAEPVRILRENPWHASQRIEERDDGTWLLELELGTSRELVHRVLALGPDALVLEPLELREEIAERARRMAARYGAVQAGRRRMAQSRTRSVRDVS
jgi:predicted DNA-binding transcriptional regulator YafY